LTSVANINSSSPLIDGNNISYLHKTVIL
jgi:hypothetical protein